MSRPLRLYWSSSLKGGRRNFGDWLSPALVELLSGRPVVHAPPARCDLIAVGSVLQKLREHWWNRRVHVWGSGFIEPVRPNESKHQYHALRGRLSAACITNSGGAVLGDPGLLSDMLVSDRPAKRFKVGIVPHYKDQNLPDVREFLSRNLEAVLVDVLGGVQEFIRQVAQCEVVLSSSLHGLIVADSLGVPNAWVRLSDQVRGSGFKYRDYYSVFGIEPPEFALGPQTSMDAVLAIAQTYARPGLAQIKQTLIESFPFSK